MAQSLLQHPATLALSRLLLAGVFLVSARGKLRDPRGFVQLVVAYRILPLPLARLYGRLLPWLEAGLGVWLVLGVAAEYAGALAGLLLLSFAFAVATNLVRGRRHLACGCFGRDETLGPATLLREGLLLLPALHLPLLPATPPTDALARLIWRPAPLDWLALALSLAGLGAIHQLGRALLALLSLDRRIAPTPAKEARS
jgi:uncharacterized membrane protein YphA (DoxX/SURF4 family)